MLRLRRVLRRFAIVALAGGFGYLLVGWIVSQLPGVKHDPDLRIWPRAMPDWPFEVLIVAGGIAVVIDVLVWLVLESRARGERERLTVLAEQWPQRAEARAAAASGLPALRVSRFRAQPMALAVRLDWTEPASSFDRILIYRSSMGFALSPAGGPGQAVAYEGEEEECVDGPLPAGRVFFYTLFALGRGPGESSPPAWAWAVTLRPGKRS